MGLCNVSKSLYSDTWVAFYKLVSDLCAQHEFRGSCVTPYVKRPATERGLFLF